MPLQDKGQKAPCLSGGMNGPWHTSNKCAILSAPAVSVWMLPGSTGYGPSCCWCPTVSGGAGPSRQADPVGAGTVARCACPAGRENLPIHAGECQWDARDGLAEYEYSHHPG